MSLPLLFVLSTVWQHIRTKYAQKFLATFYLNHIIYKMFYETT